MNVIKPYHSSEESHPCGRVVIGTVKWDYHDIDKNLVKMMLESSGFAVIELGVDEEPTIFIKEVIEQKADILAMSALITTTMPAMVPVIDLLEEYGIRKDVKVLVGGAPLTAEYAQSVNADGYR